MTPPTSTTEAGEPELLEAALACLASLPLDVVPEPAALPAASSMPFSPDPRFLGRQAELKRLASLLKPASSEGLPIAAVTGPPGVGKTRLAAEFVHRYGRFFLGGVFWLNLADGRDLPAQVALCGGPRALALREDFDALPQSAQCELVRAAWRDPLPRLLIFEDCEDEALLSQWLPPAGGCRVLLVGREAIRPGSDDRCELALRGLTLGDSMALLRSNRPDLQPDDAELALVAEALSGLPLALRIAAGFLGRLRYESRGLPAAYLAELLHPDLPSRQAPAAAAQRPSRLAARAADCFLLSYRQLDPDDQLDATSKAALLCASCLAAGFPIPHALLRASLRLAEDDEETNRLAEAAFERGQELGMLEEGGEGTVILHPLLAGLARGESAEALPAAHAAVENAVLAEANRLNQMRRPAALAAWRPHLRAVVDAAVARESGLAGALLSALGTHLDMIGERRAALEAFEHSLRITVTLLGPEHPGVASRLHNIGIILRELGELDAASAAFERALRIDEAAMGPAHPNIAGGLGNLGGVLHALGHLQRARDAYERALKIDEKALGAAHPIIAVRLGNLGSVLRALGDFPGARSAHERAVRIDEMVLGPRHPHLAVCLSNLGVVLRDLGLLPRARASLERAVHVDEATLGPSHPHLAISLGNLAVVLSDLGEFAAARGALERSLAISQAQPVPDQAVIAIMRRNLERMGLS